MEYQVLVQPALIIVGLMISVVSAYWTHTHSATAFVDVRKLLVFAYIAVGARISFEALKLGPYFQVLAPYYALGGVAVSSVFVVLVTLASLGIYLESSQDDMLSTLKTILQHRKQAALLIALAAYATFLVAFVALQEPYTLQKVADIAGVELLSLLFAPMIITMIIPILLTLFYTSYLILIASRRFSDRELKRSLTLFGSSWAGIAIIFLAFNLYQYRMRVDIDAPMYFVICVMFSFTTLSFNKSSTLAGFLDYEPEQVSELAISNPFSKRLGQSPDFLFGRQFLMEVDTSRAYGIQVRDFCIEFLSQGGRVFVVTQNFGPIYKNLSKYHHIRFYLLSSAVSHLQVTENENEILVPHDNLSQILDVIEKSLESIRQQKLALVFDNLTDLITSSGFESSYKFLREVNEYFSAKTTTSMFLLFSGTLDERSLNIIRSLYSNRLSVTSSGLKLERALI